MGPSVRIRFITTILRKSSLLSLHNDLFDIRSPLAEMEMLNSKFSVCNIIISSSCFILFVCGVMGNEPSCLIQTRPRSRFGLVSIRNLSQLDSWLVSSRLVSCFDTKSRIIPFHYESMNIKLKLLIELQNNNA